MSVEALDWSDPTTYRFPSSGGCVKSTSHTADVGQGHSDWDVVIGADVVWLEELVPMLVGALSALCGPHTVLLLSHQKRAERTDSLLFDSLGKIFVLEKVSRYQSFALFFFLLIVFFCM